MYQAFIRRWPGASQGIFEHSDGFEIARHDLLSAAR
jgi:hypothetical protein